MFVSDEEPPHLLSFRSSLYPREVFTHVSDVSPLKVFIEYFQYAQR